MKGKGIGLLAAVLVICGLLTGGLIYTARSHRQTRSIDLSFRWEGEAMPQDWVYDQKGWSVFAQQGDTPQPLSPDGFGGFGGHIQPGQTFYFSRVLEEGLTGDLLLQLNTYQENVAVFLDGQLLYTDCPEQEGRIGYLTLTQRQTPRTAALMVSLPDGSQGKTLTIAQSTTTDWEMPVVWPVSVSLLCQGTVEGWLLEELLPTLVPAGALFAAGAALLLLFLLGLLRHRRDVGLLLAALLLFFWMGVLLMQSSVTGVYHIQTPVDALELCKGLALTALLALLAHRAGRFRRAFWVPVGLTGLSCLLCVWLDLRYEELTGDFLPFLRFTLPQMTGFLSLVAFWVGAWAFWWRERRFYAFFAPLSLVSVALLVLYGGLKDGSQLLQQLTLAVRYQTPAYFLWPLTLGASAAALLALGLQAAEEEMERRARERLMLERSELAMSHYESLRAQNEQVMMLLHDMNKHYSLLRQRTGEEQVRRYLDELLAQNESIRPVVQSGNRMLDVILNGKLTQAINSGVRIELVRTHAPEKLPLTDRELCSLVMNLMDNAVAGVLDSGVQSPLIKLDLHTKNGFFVFCLSNSARRQEKKKSVPEHGLGLKIVGRIVERCGGLLEAEQDDGTYRVTLALPLSTPDTEAAGCGAPPAGTC